jgi:virulence-associated protein VapD
MFAVAFDLRVVFLQQHHPKGVAAAYSDIGRTLAQFGFERAQGSVYITKNDDLANLFSAMLALKALPWFPTCVTDIRAFKVEHWSDFTKLIKS